MNQHTALSAKMLLEKIVGHERFAVIAREKPDGEWCVDVERMPDWDANGVINYLAGYLADRTVSTKVVARP